MRYWKSKTTDRVIRVDLLMVPEKWIEITKEEYEIFKSSPELPEKNN